MGGMGTVSFILCDIARELGATVAAGVPVARILPGEGVRLDDGTVIHAPVVISNADPRVTLRLLGEEADAGWRAQVESMPITGCTVKLNMLLRELPNFTARPGTNEPHHAGPDQYAALETGMARRLRGGAARRAAGAALDRAVLPDGSRSEPSRQTACTR